MLFRKLKQASTWAGIKERFNRHIQRLDAEIDVTDGDMQKNKTQLAVLESQMIEIKELCPIMP